MRLSHALVVAFALSPVVARGEEPPPARWYGWQLMLADVAAVGVLTLGAGIDSDGVMLAGYGAYVINGTVIHLVHDRRGHAALSGVLRGGLPLTFGLLAAAACDEDDEDRQSFDIIGCGAQVGGAALGGAVVALVIDYAFLSYDVPDPPVGVAIAPRGEGGITIAIGGSF